MIQEVIKKGCIKDHVRMGFIESRRIEDIFDRIKPSIEMKVKTTADWITTIDQLFEE